MRAAGVPARIVTGYAGRLLQRGRRLLAGVPQGCPCLGGNLGRGPRLGARGPDRRGRPGEYPRHHRRPAGAAGRRGPTAGPDVRHRRHAAAVAGTTSCSASTRCGNAACCGRWAYATPKPGSWCCLRHRRRCRLGFTLWLLLREHQDRSDPLVRAWRQFTRRLRRAGIQQGAERRAPEFRRARRGAAAGQCRRVPGSASVTPIGAMVRPTCPKPSVTPLSRELRGFRVDRPAATR